MFNWLRGKRNEGASESTKAQNQKWTAGVSSRYGYYTQSGLEGRNDSFQVNKWGAAAAVISTPYAYATVNKIVADFEAVNYRLIREDTGEVLVDNENIGNDPLMNALDHYARTHDGFSLFGYWALHKFQTGEAYVELVRNDYGKPRGLDMLNSLFVTKEVDGRGNVTYWYGGANQYIRYQASELLFDRFRTNIFTEVDGTPPLLSNLNSGTLSALRSSGRAMLAYFENDGIPRALVTPTDGDRWDTVQEQSTIKRALEANKGAGNSYKTQVFPYPIDVSIFDPPDLTQWMGGTEQAEKYIFSVYGIPPSVVGLSFDTRYQISEQDVPNYKRTMRSYFESIQATVNTKLLPFFNYPDGVKFEFELEPYTTFDENMIERANTAYNNGAISLNEYRRIMGFEELDGADDTYMLPAGSIPMTLQQITSGQLPQYETPLLGMQSTQPIPDVIEGKAYQYTAQDELKAWRKVANKSVERAIEFECYHLPAFVQNHIRSALKAGVEPAEVFDNIRGELTSEQLESIVNVWEELGLDFVGEIEDMVDDDNA